ncbi:helix-turn-helix transcriptional regulator [Micromonospora sp. HNM0581]|uniref:helix-turn-helix domain-containing protein n=1 Tax=Micromonospora sp. HNM0581 TaxID=2716341 RepID=UPI00146B7CC3|nr:helix-turn-helix transcriptional regulator [Micromonospora sp. HNM0581]NLU77269.1 helix-turn-helix transcriptional regulator [Micromonospora sp. HNM0581]
MPPGERIRLYRVRRGLTQEAAAQLVGKSIGAWRKWESGERSPSSLADWIEIARVLGVRDLYTLTGLPFGALPDDPVEHETVGPLRAAMTAYRPTVDEVPDAATLTASVRLAWTTWYQSPQRFSYTGPILPGLVHAARAAADAAEGADRRAVQRATCDLYLLVRPYCKRVGAQDLAAVAADRAMTAALEADDPSFRAAAAWNLGQTLSNRGFAEHAIDVCAQAIADTRTAEDPATVAALGGLHLLTAVQHARRRDERQAALALERADELAAKVGETTHHWLFFGPTNVGVHRAAVALDLSRSGEALRIGERVDAGRSPSIERRRTHLLHMARAYANRREDFAAVHMLLAALRTSPEDAGVPLMQGTVRELLTRETPTTRADVRRLAAAAGII